MSHDVHADVGAYVVGALTSSERDAFEAHLPHCAQCTREVAEFSETVAELATLTATPPPPELKSSVLAAVRQVRPLPPEQPTDEPAPAEPRRALGPTPAGVPARTGPTDELATRRRRRERVLPLLVAAALVVALALGGWVVNLRQQLGDVTSVAAEESELLAAPDVRVVTIELPEGGRASYALSREQDRVMLAAPALSDAPEGRAYQLWTMQLDEAGAPIEASIEPHDVFAGGQDVRVFFDGLRGTDALAITVEDEAGATTPNMSTIFGIAPV